MSVGPIPDRRRQLARTRRPPFVGSRCGSAIAKPTLNLRSALPSHSTVPAIARHRVQGPPPVPQFGGSPPNANHWPTPADPRAERGTSPMDWLASRMWNFKIGIGRACTPAAHDASRLPVALRNMGFQFSGHGLAGGQVCNTWGGRTSQERLPACGPDRVASHRCRRQAY
jgi:hypothetical protein